jgi:hypothetical protein
MDPITFTIALGASGAGGAAESYWFTMYYAKNQGATKLVSVVSDSAGNVFTHSEMYAPFLSGFPGAWGNAITGYDKDGVAQFIKDNSLTSSNVAGGKQDIAVDGNDNVYIASNEAGTSGGGFIAKYNNSGTRQWHKKSYVTNGGFTFSGVRVDSNDNIYAAGKRTVSGSYAYWLVKYNTSGVVQAAKAITGSSALEMEAQGLAIDSSDNIYLTGQSGNAVVTVKLNSSLAVQWSRAYGTSSHQGRNIAADSSGNVYVRTASGSDSHVIKYNASGVLQWQQKVDSSYAVRGGLTVDSSGNVYYSCRKTISNVGNMIIVKWNSSGTVQWKRQLRNTSASDGMQGRGLFHSGNTLCFGAGIYDSYGYLYDFVGKVPDDGSLIGTYSTTDFGNIVYEVSTVSVTTPTFTDASYTASISSMTDQTESNSGMTEYSATFPDEENITLS